MLRLQDIIALIPLVIRWTLAPGDSKILTLIERMTLGDGAIFFVYFSHNATMPCQPEGLGIHIYRLPTSQAYAKMLS